MAEFSEVMCQLNRLCSHSQECSESGCPMFDECGNIGAHCSSPKHSCRIEKIVMEWAAEHPEPVYPTWGEWLMSIGVINGVHPHGAIDMLGNLKQPIPADIAQKLGLQPKEG